MRRDWLLYLVIFSLALNVGTIGTFTYLRYQDRQGSAASVAKEELPPMPMREMWQRLDLDQEQRRWLDQVVPEHRRRLRALRSDLAEKRRELFGLLKKDTAPDWPTVQSKIREVSDLQGKLEEEIIRHLLTMKEQLKPEQQAIFVELLEQRLRPFERRRGPRWERHGPPHGRPHGPPMERGPGPGSGYPWPPPPPGAG
jgi:Spy/CpxP family protein refolding chaperone